MINLNIKEIILNIKGKSKEDWQEFFADNSETLFIVGQIILLIVLFQFRTIERRIEYEVPDVQADPSVERVFPNPAYKAIVEAPQFDFMESDLIALGSKNIFDFKFVKDPHILEAEIVELEDRANNLFEQERYQEALEAVEEVLLLNPYREASLELKQNIEQKMQE